MLKHFESLQAQAHTRNYGAGNIIVYQGEVPRTACVLIKGTVRVYNISAEGDEQVVMLHKEGEFFPSSWIFNKSVSSIFFYEALSDCEVAFISKETLLEHMMATSERALEMVDYLATSYTACLVRINALEQTKAREKLIYTLYYLCQRYGLVGGSDGVAGAADHAPPHKVNGTSDAQVLTVPIPLTHQMIANLVGLTRETTAMELSKLKKQKLIRYKNQIYTIDMRKLLEAMGEDSFGSISIES